MSRGGWLKWTRADPALATAERVSPAVPAPSDLGLRPDPLLGGLCPQRSQGPRAACAHCLGVVEAHPARQGAGPCAGQTRPSPIPGSVAFQPPSCSGPRFPRLKKGHDDSAHLGWTVRTPGGSREVVRTGPGMSCVPDGRQPSSLHRLRPQASQLLGRGLLLPTSPSWVLVEEPPRAPRGLSSTYLGVPLPGLQCEQRCYRCSTSPAHMMHPTVQGCPPAPQVRSDPRCSRVPLHSCLLETRRGESSCHRARAGPWRQ